MQRSLTVGIFALAAVLGGCSTTDSLTAVSSKNVNIADLKLDQSRDKGQGFGESCQQIITFIPVGEVPNVKNAIDRAVESRRGNVLLNARVKSGGFYIPLIYGKTCYTVEGEVYDAN
jgi:hypothetical protein